MKKIKLGISSCLLGQKVRYDGGHKLDHFLADTLGQFVEWVPVCPEVGSGLSVPREAMRLVGKPDSPRLVTVRTGKDFTDAMQEWAEKKLDELEKEDLCGFVFKSRSPSSGMRRVKVYTSSGKISGSGAGIFGGAFVKRFPLTPAEEDGRLHDPALRENFIERVFVFKRWREFEKGDGSVRGLLQFHTDLKLLVLAHSPRHYSALGNLIAKARKDRTESLRRDYAGLLMEGLGLEATVKKNANVLQHMMGYFKKLLTEDEKKELLEIITEYHKGFIPLIVPVVLIRHYVRKYEVSYLRRQLYINPHPVELMLRNHV